MTTEQNKEVIRRFYDAMNSGDAKAAASFWNANPINHGRQVETKAMESLFEIAVQVHEHVTIHEMVAEGDWVACRLTVLGRHKIQPPVPLDGGIYLLSEPDGRSFSFQHIHMFMIVDGKIKEHWANRDDLGAARQLGLELKPKNKGTD